MDMDICEYKIKYIEPVAGKHRINLNEFCKSLQGFASVISTIGNELLHQPITVETDAKIKQGSVEISAFLTSLQQAVGDITALKEIYNVVIKYIYSSKGQTEMDSVLELVKQEAQLRHEEHIKALEIISELADKAIQQSISMVGKQCQKIEIYDEENKNIAVIDKDLRNILCQKEKEDVISEEKEFEIIFCEMDLEKRSCKFYMNDDYQVKEEDEDIKVYKAKINDPDFDIPGNDYIKSFGEQKSIKVTVKIQSTKTSMKYFIMGKV